MPPMIINCVGGCLYFYFHAEHRVEGESDKIKESGSRDLHQIGIRRARWFVTAKAIPFFPITRMSAREFIKYQVSRKP